MTEARLKAESHSLSAKRQMLIIAALVTESLQPVRQPIKRQNKVCTMNAFLRLTLNTLSTIGMHAIKPAKCVRAEPGSRICRETVAGRTPKRVISPAACAVRVLNINGSSFHIWFLLLLLTVLSYASYFSLSRIPFRNSLTGERRSISDRRAHLHWHFQCVTLFPGISSRPHLMFLFCFSAAGKEYRA